MAKYTIELRDIVNNSTIEIGLQNYVLYTPKLFKPDDYGKDYLGNPITNFRQYLNNRLIKHYYFREIGFETAPLFIFKLNAAMEEIMPFYNQMLKSTDTEFNPLWNVEIHETFTHSTTDNGESTTTGTITGKTTTDSTENANSTTNENLSQNSSNNSTRTPNLKNENTTQEMDTAETDMTIDNIKAGGFTSRAKHDINEQTGTETLADSGSVTNDNDITTDSENTVNSEQNSTNNSNIKNNDNRTRTETYTKLTEGSSAGLPYSDAIKQWRNIMVNIEMMIVEDKKIKELFMLIY